MSAGINLVRRGYFRIEEQDFRKWLQGRDQEKKIGRKGMEIVDFPRDGRSTYLDQAAALELRRTLVNERPLDFTSPQHGEAR